MARLSISLSDERHRALKETAARQRKTIAQIIDESLELYGVKTRDRAREILRRAWARATLSEEQAMRLAVEVTRKVRKERHAGSPRGR